MSGSFFSLFGDKLNHIVNAEDSDGSLSCKSKRVNLRNHWLQYSCLEVVTRSSFCQIQTTVLQLKLLWISLSLSL